MASPGYRRCPQDTAYPQDTDGVLRIPRYPQDTAGVLRYNCPHDAAVSSGYRVLRMPSVSQDANSRLQMSKLPPSQPRLDVSARRFDSWPPLTGGCVFDSSRASTLLCRDASLRNYSMRPTCLGLDCGLRHLDLSGGLCWLSVHAHREPNGPLLFANTFPSNYPQVLAALWVHELGDP